MNLDSKRFIFSYQSNRKKIIAKLNVQHHEIMIIEVTIIKKVG